MMVNAVRYIQEINTDSISLDVAKYNSTMVEIIILPLDTESENSKQKTSKSLKGCLHKYSNPPLIEKEKNAWKDAVKTNHV